MDDAQSDINNNSCTSNYISSKPAIKAVIVRANGDLNTKDIMNTIRSDSGIDIKYITAYKAIESYRIEKGIILKDSYSYINSLIESLDENLTCCKLEMNDLHFKRFLKKDPKLFVEHYFTSRNYNVSYSGHILPLTNINLVQNELLPPEVRRSRGRPRVSRFRSITEH